MIGERPATVEVMSDLRALIVEDEALIGEELRDRLSRLGMIVVGVVDTSDDGIQAAAEIRRRLDVPIVFVTAHSDRMTVDRAKRAAPSGYLLKPFHERQRRVTLEMALHRHALEKQLKQSDRLYAPSGHTIRHSP